LAKNDRGRLFDSQGGRLIFPIINAFDEVVGFGGRVLQKGDYAKYKNTKETMLFDKSKTLYNVNLLKKLKREQAIPNVIIVEGYMDTISLYQAGFRNVVASMGTSLTKDQARLVKRYSENVLISYDGDFAGQNADLRGIEILKSEGLNVRVVPMPDGLDPDDVAKQGKDAYQKCLDEAMPLIDYRLHTLEKRFDLTKSEDKRRYVSAALKVINTAESASLKEELLKRLSGKAGVSYAALERDLESLKGTADNEDKEPKVEKIAEAEAGTDKHKKAKRFILAAKLFSAPYAAGVSLDELPFANETHIIIAKYIAEHESRGERIRPSELFELLDEDCEEFNAILDLNYGDKLTGETAERFFFDSVKTLKLQMIDEAIAECNARYIQETDLEKRKEISKTLQTLISKKKELKRKN